MPTLSHFSSVKSPLCKAFLSTAIFPEPSLTPHSSQGPYPRLRYFEGRSHVFWFSGSWTDFSERADMKHSTIYLFGNFRTWRAGLSHCGQIWLEPYLWGLGSAGHHLTSLHPGFPPTFLVDPSWSPMRPPLLQCGLAPLRFWHCICGVFNVYLLPAKLPHFLNYHSLANYSQSSQELCLH